ncbi:dUTP diphosphatase [Brachybacterium sp. DNPG3]
MSAVTPTGAALRAADPETVPDLRIRLEPGAPLPSRAHADDAGLDLVSAEDVEIAPGGRALVDTGMALALPAGTVGLVCPRSGLAAKHGVTVLNGPGIVDAGYRGTIRVALHNTDLEHPVSLVRGDRIAQLVIVPFFAPALAIVDELEDTERADAGFGSTGGHAASTREA